MVVIAIYSYFIVHAWDGAEGELGSKLAGGTFI